MFSETDGDILVRRDAFLIALMTVEMPVGKPFGSVRELDSDFCVSFPMGVTLSSPSCCVLGERILTSWAVYSCPHSDICH